MTTKKPARKTPPAKKTATPVFEPVFMVIEDGDNKCIGKRVFVDEGELEKFYDENNMSPDDVNIVTEEEFDAVEIIDTDVTDDKPTEIVLPETPEVEFKEDELPNRLNVESKKTGLRHVVNKKYFLANRGELNLV